MTTRLTALFVITALLGFLIGARAVGTPSPAASAPSVAAGVREMDPLRGGFWRPVGSDAQRPVARLAPVSWTPSAPDASGRQADALAGLQAVAASLE